MKKELNFQSRGDKITLISNSEWAVYSMLQTVYVARCEIQINSATDERTARIVIFLVNAGMGIILIQMYLLRKYIKQVYEYVYKAKMTRYFFHTVDL